MVERNVETVEGSVIELTSSYSVENLPDIKTCDFCEGPMELSTSSFFWQHFQSGTSFRAENIPVYKCKGDNCGVELYDPHVALELVEKIQKGFVEKGIEPGVVLEASREQLEVIIKDSPSVCNLPSN